VINRPNLSVRSLVQALENFNFSYILSEDAVERKIAALCVFFLLSEILQKGREQFDAQRLNNSEIEMEEMRIEGPFVVIDSILYLKFDRGLSIDTHRKTYKSVRGMNQHLDQKSILFSYLLQRKDSEEPIFIGFTYERAVEVLTNPSTLSCLPDPASTQLFVNLAPRSLPHPAFLTFCHLKFEAWAKKWESRHMIMRSPVFDISRKSSTSVKLQDDQTTSKAKETSFNIQSTILNLFPLSIKYPPNTDGAISNNRSSSEQIQSRYEIVLGETPYKNSPLTFQRRRINIPANSDSRPITNSASPNKHGPLLRVLQATPPLVQIKQADCSTAIKTVKFRHLSSSSSKQAILNNSFEVKRKEEKIAANPSAGSLAKLFATNRKGLFAGAFAASAVAGKPESRTSLHLIFKLNGNESFREEPSNMDDSVLSSSSTTHGSKNPCFFRIKKHR